ncbi:hypothetical protein GCM10022234_21750 [Aeromicrobium panaciterrae]
MNARRRQSSGRHQHPVDVVTITVRMAGQTHQCGNEANTGHIRTDLATKVKQCLAHMDDRLKRSDPDHEHPIRGCG